MQQLEIRPPTDETLELAQEIISLLEQREAEVPAAHEAMLWTICLSAGLNAGAVTFPPQDYTVGEGRDEYMRMLTFFTSLRMLTAGLIDQL